MWGMRTSTGALRGDPGESRMVCGGVRQAVGMDSEPRPKRGGGAAPASGTQSVSEKEDDNQSCGRRPLDQGARGALGAQGGTHGGGEGAETEDVGGTKKEAWRGKGVVNTETVTRVMIGSTTGIAPGDGSKTGGGHPDSNRPMALPWH